MTLRPRKVPKGLAPEGRTDQPRYRILYVAPAWEGCTSRQRAQSLVDLGHTLNYIDFGGIKTPVGGAERVYKAVRRRLGRPAEWKAENSQVRHALDDQQYDVVWIDKGLTIRPATLSHIKAQSPKAMVVSYSADDMTNPGNQSAYWKQGLSAYDLVVTTKKHNIHDLQLMGARNVFYVDKSFDPHTHRPVQISRADKGAYGADVSFVGGFEPQRARSMQVLAENGYSIRVWGPTWDDRFRFGLDKLRIEGRPAYGDEYAKVVSASKINLCFLRKVNRDQQTARTMELPACGGFMLAERTSEHQRLFEEGQEAEFFGSDQELIDKVRFYLMSPEKRLAIAASGRQRCLNSGYSNHFRMDAISRKISELRVKE